MSKRYENAFARRQHGVTLVEVMIAMLVGLILLAGITTLVVNASRGNRDIDAAARQLENGRYAVKSLSKHLQHAGFWGRLYPPAAPGMPSVPGGLPNACTAPVTAAILQADMPLHIQGEDSPAGDPAANCLGDADHVDGTDIVTVRRAAGTDHTPTEANDAANAAAFYLQTSHTAFDIDTGANADPGANGFGITELDAAGNAVTAPLYQYRVDTFFVSPRTRPVNVGACDGDDADNGDEIPTLMHLRLVDTGFCAQAVATGVEDMQIEYGVDTTNNGTPNQYTTAPADTTAWSNVMGVRLYLLVRSTENVGAIGANKSYNLGQTAPKVVADPGDGFSRHVFTTTARLVNPSGRRETP